MNHNRNLQKNCKNSNKTRTILQYHVKSWLRITHNFYKRTNLIENFEKISYVIPKFIIKYKNLLQKLIDVCK